MKSMLRLFAFVSVLAGVGHAQNEAKKIEKWPVEITVNLMISDAAGNPADNILASDIKIFENDIEQKVNVITKRSISNIVFLVDNTGSMRSQLQVIEALANTITDNLGTSAKACVIRFVTRGQITVEQDWTTDNSKLRRAFSDMFIEGGQSAVRDAIYLSAVKLIDVGKTKKDARFAIILISDGEDRDSYYSEKQLFDLLRDTSVQVFPIGLLADLDNVGYIRKSPRDRIETFLRTLAVRSGGAAFILNHKYQRADLEASVIGVINELRSPYVLSYTSTNQNHDGEERKLRVEIADGPKGEKRTAMFRKSFIFPKN